MSRLGTKPELSLAFSVHSKGHLRSTTRILSHKCHGGSADFTLSQIEFRERRKTTTPGTFGSQNSSIFVGAAASSERGVG